MNAAVTFVFGAHSDDIAYSLGAALRDGRLAGCRPVTVFSRSGWTAAAPAGDVERVTALRKEEDRRFFAQTAVGAPLWLDLPDAPLRGIPGDASVFVAPLPEPEIEQVERAMAGVLPPHATLLVPLALGAHLDHRLVRAAACRFLHHCHQVLFYEDLPYAAFMEPSSITAEVAALSRELCVALDPIPWRSSELAAAKRWAAECYASQSDHATLGHLLRHAARLEQGGVPAERVWWSRGG